MSNERPQSMSPELKNITDFLGQSLPFNTLAPQLLQQAAAAIVISYHVHSEVFRADTEPMGLRVVRSGAIDIRDQDNKLLDRLGEGESFHIGGLNAERSDVQAIVIEDALLYLLPNETYQALRSADRNFDRYFSGQRSRRLRRAARYQADPNSMMREVSCAMSSDLLRIPLAASIQETAIAMSARNVSSAFVMDADQLVGIVTDRDLRNRCLAQGLSMDAPIHKIMTANPYTINSSETLFEATLTMAQKGFHHLPVMANDKLAGIITTSDLILARQDDPIYLVRHIARQTSSSAIASLLQGLPNLLIQWVKSGIKAQYVSSILTTISDATTVRLIQLAEEQLGPAPCAWCWVCFGSQARAEQLLGADQDNGIIIANSRHEPDTAQWFAKLAQYVCDGLNECGYPYCPGNIMATNNEWRLPLQQWQETVHRWTRSPTADAVMRVSIFFDIRPLYGDVNLAAALQNTMLEQACSNSIFQAALAANALASKPPLGIFRRFVVDRNGEHRDSLDLKKCGILPITEIVRLHALAANIKAINTNARIDALVKANSLTLEDSRNLADALHCIQQQRINHQCDQILAGEKVSNYINPKSLSKLAKEHLRDAFTIIDEAQTAVRQRYRAGMA